MAIPHRTSNNTLNNNTIHYNTIHNNTIHNNTIHYNTANNNFNSNTIHYSSSNCNSQRLINSSNTLVGFYKIINNSLHSLPHTNNSNTINNNSTTSNNYCNNNNNNNNNSTIHYNNNRMLQLILWQWLPHQWARVRAKVWVKVRVRGKVRMLYCNSRATHLTFPQASMISSHFYDCKFY